ncbi:MAG: DUF973 family protein [Desulfurococcales archaeon]|nr:DUF973 family protein [Desulfurococcales archaeon]
MIPYKSELTKEKLQLLKIGFLELREGSLYAVIGDLLGLIGLVEIVAVLGFPFDLNQGETLLEASASALLIGAAIALVGIIISLVGLIRWKNGGRYFREFDPINFSSAETGPALMLWSTLLVVFTLVVFIAGVLALSWGVVVTSLVIALVASILVLIGAILFGVFLLKIKDLQLLYGLSMPDFTIDAVLWFLGLVFQVLYLVAEILIYIHAGEALTAIIIKEKEIAGQES